MFGRMEQIAIREMIEGREKLLARIAALESDVANLTERLSFRENQIADMQTRTALGNDAERLMPKERKRARG